MLQAIRSQATSFVVKILFGALIVSFAVWGIGDIFRDNGNTDTTVATVGGQDIGMQQVSQQVQAQLNRLRQVFGNDIDIGQAKKLGVVDQALDGLVASTLVDLEINRLGLSIG
ncbi:MAG: SurA N-terminal domain-containing protein, partial [Stellaceae bacterium]